MTLCAGASFCLFFYAWPELAISAGGAVLMKQGALRHILREMVHVAIGRAGRCRGGVRCLFFI